MMAEMALGNLENIFKKKKKRGRTASQEEFDGLIWSTTCSKTIRDTKFHSCDTTYKQIGLIE